MQAIKKKIKMNTFDFLDTGMYVYVYIYIAHTLKDRHYSKKN